jgi:small subunit ribosomal protein S9
VASHYYYGTGRRKTATARVRLYPGDGGFVVNDKPADEYFSRAVDLRTITAPLRLTENADSFRVSVVVSGGGITGQAGAIRHGIARALLEADPDLRLPLRRAGYLTRDPRAKERKKPGLKRARKAPQYTKR